MNLKSGAKPPLICARDLLCRVRLGDLDFGSKVGPREASLRAKHRSKANALSLFGKSSIGGTTSARLEAAIRIMDYICSSLTWRKFIIYTAGLARFARSLCWLALSLSISPCECCTTRHSSCASELAPIAQLPLSWRPFWNSWRSRAQR